MGKCLTRKLLSMVESEFENEFLAIIYNDALTSKPDLSTEMTFCPQDIDEFDLKDEASLIKRKYRSMESVNGMLFNLIKNLYVPFGILFDPKRYYKDGDCARMLWRPSVSIYEYAVSTLRTEYLKFYNLFTILSDFADMTPLPLHDQRHIWIRYQVEGYTKEIVHDFEQRLEMIFNRQVNRVHILDFEGLTPDMRQDLAERMRMVYTGDNGQEVFVSHAWRRLFGIRVPLVQEFLLEFFSTCRIGDEMGLDVAGDDGFGAYWDFLRGAPSYTYIRDPVRRLCHRLIFYSISGRGRHLKRYAKGRKSDARLSGGHFIRRLAQYFGLVSDDGLRGLSVMASAEDALAVDKGVQADPSPIQAPQQPPPPPPTVGRTMPQRLGRLEEEVQGLRLDVRTL
ncbi:hypothetical protein Tco_0712653 [Tanacetum coccineum]